MVSNIRSIIVDDESSSILAMSRLLEVHAPYITIEGTATSPEEAAMVIKDTKPDLVFLDIEMPGSNAFELLDSLSPVNFEVIFVTAFYVHAAKAFRYAAIDYIMKPINTSDLLQALEKAKKKIGEKRTRKNKSSNSSGSISLLADSDKISLPSNNGFRFEDINDIAYLKAEGSYTTIVFLNKPKELTSKTLKEFEEMLPDHKFCRVHHSYIINIDYVANYIKGRGGQVQLTDGSIVEISVRKKTDFLARFNR